MTDISRLHETEEQYHRRIVAAALSLTDGCTEALIRNAGRFTHYEADHVADFLDQVGPDADRFREAHQRQFTGHLDAPNP